MQNLVRRFENFYEQTGQILGQGVYAQVYLGKKKSTGESVAVKVSNRNCSVSQKEKEVLTKLMKYTHSNIVSVLDLFDQGSSMYIVQEYCRGGTLYDLITTTGQIQEELAVEIILQISEGLQFMHGLGIVHGDIKPENILRQLTKDGSKEIFKITDFGLSSFAVQGMAVGKAGTPYYIAPEIVNGRADITGFDRFVDVWALGMVFDELIHGSPFFNGTTEEEVIKKIRTENYFIRNKEIREASFFDNMRFIIQQTLINMVQEDPTHRKDLNWVNEQLMQYKQFKRKTNQQADPKKSNKQLFTEGQTIAEDVFDFLSQNFPNESLFLPEQKIEPKFSVTLDNDETFRTYVTQNTSLSSGPQKVSNVQQKQIIQQIQQKYQQSSLDRLSQDITLCIEHKQPIKFRYPSYKRDQSLMIVPACIICLRTMGVYETDVLLKIIDETLSYRFEFFYRTTEIQQKLQMLLQKLQCGDIELKETSQLQVILKSIQDDSEQQARSVFLQKVKQLEQFKLRGLKGDDEWIIECLKRQGNQEENQITQELKQNLSFIQDRAVEECKKVIVEKLSNTLLLLKEKLKIE